MSINFEAIDLPLNNETYLAAMREAVAECNGFVYAGENLESQIRLVKWMRLNPEKARLLIEFVFDQGQTEKTT